VRISAIEAAVDIAIIRASPGGDRLSAETVLILAFFMDPKNETAIELAKRLGTYGKIDRSAQYEGNYSPRALLNNDNLHFMKLRQLERMQMRNNVIMLVTAAITLVTALITRGSVVIELMRRTIGR
jgi:Flp pilus assembly protein TadB